jgi:hypothetical protein
MATVDKNFRIKNGLVVEGTTGTINDSDIITAEAISNGAAENENIVVTYDAQTKKLTFVAENGVADSTTDDLAEGTTSLYFTDERAQDAIADAINAGTHENITITYNDETNSFSFVAENGVDDSTTDDLDEGDTNLYFTEQRARDSVSAGEGLSYDGQTGEFSADLADGLAIVNGGNAIEVVTGNGIEIGPNGQVQIDTSITIDVDSAQTLSNKTLGTSLDADDNSIINVATPTEDHHAANKGYVDEVAQGLKVRGNVEAATVADLGGTYNNGTNGVDATITIPATEPLDIDGWTSWSQFDGILVKNQTNAEENGRYFVFVKGDSGTSWVLKRCIDCDTDEEIPGSFVFVQHGNIYGQTGWVATVDNIDTFSVGIDDIDWVQFSGAGTYTAGNGLELNGTEFAIDTTVTADLDTAQTLTNKSIAGDENTLTNIANASLVNDSITVNSYEVELGSALTLATDDIDEGQGATNLYFTDQRAVDALEAVVPNFTAVEINSVSKQIAATATMNDGQTTTVYSFDSTEYRSAKLIVKAALNTHTEVAEILLTLDTSNNIAITEYAIVGTNGNIVDITAEFDPTTNNVDIVCSSTATNDTNIAVVVAGTLIA